MAAMATRCDSDTIELSLALSLCGSMLDMGEAVPTALILALPTARRTTGNLCSHARTCRCWNCSWRAPEADWNHRLEHIKGAAWRSLEITADRWDQFRTEGVATGSIEAIVSGEHMS